MHKSVIQPLSTSSNPTKDTKSGLGDNVANPDIPVSTKKIVERITFLFNQHKEMFEVSKKQLESKLVEKQFKKHCESIELMSEHRNYLERTEIQLQGAFLFHSSVDALFTLFFYHSKYKRELKTMLHSHTKNEKKVETLYRTFSDLDAKRLTLKDEIKNSEFVYLLYNATDDKEGEKYEEELINIVTHIPADAIIPNTLIMILHSLEDSTIQQAYNRVEDYLQEGRVDEHIATLILSMGLKIVHMGDATVGLKVIRRAEELLKKHCGKESMKHHLYPLVQAFALRHNDKSSQAATALNKVIEDIRDSDKFQDPETMFLVLQLTYFLEKWNEKLGAVNVMEEITMSLGDGLPETETMWLKSTTMTARAFNDKKRPEQAYYYLIKGIDHFHEKIFGEIGPNNKPIYEIAAELMGRGNASATLIQALSPRLGYLPPVVMDCVKELTITFAQQGNHNAVNIVEKYIKDCKDAHQEHIIFDDDEDQGMTIFKMTKGKHFNEGNTIKTPKRRETRRLTQTLGEETRKSFMRGQRAQSISEKLTGKIKKLKAKAKHSRDSISISMSKKE